MTGTSSHRAILRESVVGENWC